DAHHGIAAPPAELVAQFGHYPHRAPTAARALADLRLRSPPAPNGAASQTDSPRNGPGIRRRSARVRESRSAWRLRLRSWRCRFSTAKPLALRSAAMRAGTRPESSRERRERHARACAE